MELREAPIATAVLAISLLVTSALIGFVWVALQALSTSPTAPWPYLALGLVWLAGSISLLKATPRWPRAAMLGAFSIYLVALGLPITGRDRFVTDLSRIRPGMPRAEVTRIMAGYMRGTGWPAPAGDQGVRIVGGGSYEGYADGSGELAIEGCEIYRHSDHPDHDSDWGIVCFQADRVASVEFSPD
jgi:hypothetical protein